MTQDDLWGDLPEVESLRTPLVILKEQAEVLKEKTEGLLVGEIIQKQTGINFIYDLSIVAPTLNNYVYKLLTVVHGIGFYPARIIDQQSQGVQKKCSNEEEYKQGLREILSSNNNRAVISKLLTHVRSQ
jgi:hypothetical protein